LKKKKKRSTNTVSSAISTNVKNLDLGSTLNRATLVANGSPPLQHIWSVVFTLYLGDEHCEVVTNFI